MKWRVEVIADNSGRWCCNALRYETQAEAEAEARDLAGRWTLVRAWRVVDDNVPRDETYKGAGDGTRV